MKSAYRIWETGWNMAMLPGLLFVCLSSPAVSQAPTGPEILDRCERVFAEIEDYTADLMATINMERVRMPAMKATLYFKQPDRVHIKSESFAMLPREGFAMPVAALAARYDATFQEKEIVDGQELFRLLLTAKESSTRVQSITVWVDPSNYTIVQTTSSPYRGRIVTVKFRHTLHEGRFWLPERVTAIFTSTAPDTSANGSDLFALKPQLEEFRRPPRNGSIEITYAHYEVNSGLSDEVFRREQE
ncbi:MAG: hypothetical protein HY563_05035 [Ignavibacteriales bacterium]|nr:hypothetical protein [Ignavibacteriales bacterium]